MMKFKQCILNGLILNGSEPIHSIVFDYLSIRGAIVTQEGGYVIINGSYSLPNKIALFAELKNLSLHLHNDIIYDLETEVNPWGGVNYKVISKQPRDNPTPAERQIISSAVAKFLENSGQIVISVSTDKIVISGDLPIENNISNVELKDVIKAELYYIVDFTYTGDFVLPEIVYSPINNIKPVADVPVAIIPSPEEKVEAPEAVGPGLLSYYYNTVFGANNKDEFNPEIERAARPTVNP